MRMKAALAVLVLASSFIRVLSRSDGAPAEACSSFTPNHPPNSPQTAPNPYSIDLNVFDGDSNGVKYSPGAPYMLALSAPGGSPTFRGFLIQARLVADDTIVVGSFSSPPSGARLSSCTPSNSAVTHSDNTDKSSISVSRTAPASDVGSIYFAFAVVQMYGTFWADQRTAVVHDSTGVSISIDYTPPPDAVLGPNEYRAASTLVITCQFPGATGTVSYTWPESSLGSGVNDMTRQRLFLHSSHSGVQTCTATDSGTGNSGTASIPVNVVGIGVQIIVGDDDGDGVSDWTAALPNNGLVFSLTSGTRYRILCHSESSQNTVGEIIGLDGTLITTDPFTVTITNPAAIDIRSTVDIDMDDQGVYTCRLPDSSGTQLEANFGIYSSDFNTAPSIDSFSYDEATRTLTCVSTGSPATTVTWERDGSPVTIDGTDFTAAQTVTNRSMSTYTNTLTIGATATGFEGMYTCNVSNTLGSAKAAAVVVTEPILIVQPLPTLSGEAGEMGTLTCTVSVTGNTSGGTLTITWSGPGVGTTVSMGAQIPLSGETASRDLTFSPLRESHDGDYTCLATFTTPGISDSESTTVTVTRPTVSVEIDASSPGTPTVGDNYTLTCSVSEADNLQPTNITYQWRDSSGTTSITSTTETQLVFTLSLVDLSDAGTYTCEVTDSSPFLNSDIAGLSDMIDVLVQIPPPTTAITGGTGTLTAGSVQTLNCTITLDPVLETMLSEVTVSSDWSTTVLIIGSTGRVSETGAVEDPSDDRVFRNALTFNPLHSSDGSGTYTCQAIVSPMPVSAFVNNGVDSENMDITVQNPTLTAVLESNTTRLPTHPDYNTFSLTCTATASTGVVAMKTFTWRQELNGGGFTTLTDNDDSIQIETTDVDQEVSTSVLTVTETTAGQYTYRCQTDFTDGGIVPSNPDINNRRRDVDVTVTAAPSIDSFSYDEATRTLTCASTGFPATTVTWERDGSPVTVDGTDFTVAQTVTNRSMSTYTNTLTIGATATGFEGMYTCNVSNILGSAKAAAVVVTEPILIVQPLSTLSGEAGEMGTLTCTVSVTGNTSGGTLTITWSGPGVGTTVSMGAQIPLSGGTASRDLTFSPLRESHDGDYYTCLATFTTPGISDSESTTVTVTLPTVSVEIDASSPGTPTVGDNYTLTCSVSEADNLQPTNITYQWRDSSGTTSITSTTETQLVFTLSLVDLSDAGTYTCEVTVSSPFLNSDIAGLSDMIDVLVQIPPPTTAITGGTGTLTAGSVQTLNCTITLDPVLETMLSEVTVSSDWSTTVLIIGSTGRVSETGAVEDPSDDRVFRNALTFNPLHSSDGSGTYTCQAIVSPMPVSAFVNNGVDSENMDITVQNPTLTAVLEANTTQLPTHPDYNTFSLTCTATASTGVVAMKTFTWRQELNGGGFITLTDNDDFIQIETTDVDQEVSTSVLTVTETTAGQYTYRCQTDFTDGGIVPSNPDINNRRRDVDVTVTGLSNPQQPQSLMETDVTFESATIQWTVSQLDYTPETYVVEYSNDSSSLDLRSETRMSGADFTATNLMFSVLLTGLTHDTTYFYRVVATNTEGSTPSNMDTFVTPYISPDPPMNFRITVEGPTTLTFSWDAPDLARVNPSFYNLSCSPTLDGIEVVEMIFPASVPPAESRIEPLTNFEEGVTYNCTLHSRNERGSSDLVYAIATTDTAPTGPPLNFDITVEGPRDLSFSWDPPAEDHRNGVIIGYQLSCSPQPTGLPRTFNQSEFNSGGGVEVRLSGFAPSTSYNCSVLASTSAGDGPIVNKGTTTEDDAMLFQLQVTRVFPSCLEWVLQDTIAKLQGIRSAIQQNVERLCQCGFSEEHIPETQEVPIFLCFSDPTEVTFRARLAGTTQATSSELISDIEQWIASGATINVQRVGLEISTCHPVAITSISDPECQEFTTEPTTSEPTTTEPTTTPTTSESTTIDTGVPSQASQSSDNTATIIGGVVAVVIVVSIIIAGTVIVLFILKHRRGELVLQKKHVEQGKPVELTVMDKAGDASIPTTPNTAYETTTLQSHASVPTSTTAQLPQSQDYDEVVRVPGKPENTASTTAPETEDRTYDFIPGDTP